VNGRSSPYARFGRVCTIRRQIADLRLAKAERARSGLLQIAERIESLRVELGVKAGSTGGQLLCAHSEMVGRLHAAAARLAAPLREADGEILQLSDVRMTAFRREEGVQKLSERWTASEELRRVTQEDARTIFQQKPRSLEADS
jgi:hypothetical protein